MSKVFLCLFGLLSVANASGNRVGNGGDVIVCEGKAILLDFYESSNFVESYKQNKKYHEIVEDKLKSLQRLNSMQSKQYLRRYSEIKNEIQFVEKAELVDIQDSYQLLKPIDKGCVLKQAAIRKNISLDKSTRFLVAKDIWEQMDEFNKAGLIVHEIVYEHFFKLGENHSVKARQFVALLFNNKLEMMSEAEYWDLLQKNEIPIYKKK